MTVDVYTFYYAGDGAQLARRWLPNDRAACDYAAELCDELGVSIEVARGQEHDLIATYDPD